MRLTLSRTSLLSIYTFEMRSEDCIIIHMRYTEIDEALDFARDYARVNKFCAKMWKQYSHFGTLTQGQIRALLKIKRER